MRETPDPAPSLSLLALLLLLCAVPALPLRGQTTPIQERDGFIDVEGGRLYYREAGEGPAVILLHGGYLDHRMWDGQVQALARRHRVVRYDIRSHGRSSAQEVPFSDVEDLGALMDALGIRRATVVGLSLGGFIAVDFALARPERVEALALVGPGISGGTFDSPELQAYIEELRAAAIQEDFDGMIHVFTRYWCDGPYRAPEEVDPGVRSKVLEMLGGSLERWQHDPLGQAQDPPAWERVSEIEAPTLLVVGSIDMPDIQRVAEHLTVEIPSLHRVDIPGVAHMVNMEAPERFNEVLLDFLDSARRE